MSKQFAIGIYQPKTKENIGTLWRSAYIMGATFIFTIGKRYKTQASDTCKAERQIPCFNFETFADFEKNRPQNMLIIPVENCQNSISLQEFEHPKQAVYLLGAEDKGLPKEITEKYQSVIINTPKKICLNVSTTGSIVMFDRINKF